MTLLELSTTVTLAGIVMVTAIPRFQHLRDRVAVDGAAAALASTLADTRHLAARYNRRTAIRLDTVTATATVFARTDTLARLPLGTLFHVTLSATRDSLAYTPSGLGFGAANATFVVARGSAAETVTVSRVGRVRH